MSQHSQRTQFGPTTASIVTGWVMVAVSALATGYANTRPGFHPHDLVGVALGVGLTALLGVRLAGLVAERAVVRDRAERAAERDLTERAAELAAERRRERERERQRDEIAAQRDEDQRWLALGRPEPAEPIDAHGRTWTQAWDTYQMNHPEVAASWPKQNGRWPNCFCQACDPEPVDRRDAEPDETRVWLAETGPGDQDPVDQAVTGYLDEEMDPAGCPPPFNAFDPPTSRRNVERHQVAVPLPARVPVSPGRPYGGCDGSCRDEGCPAYADLQDRSTGDWPTGVIHRIEPDDATRPGYQDRSAETEVIERVR